MDGGRHVGMYSTYMPAQELARELAPREPTGAPEQPCILGTPDLSKEQGSKPSFAGCPRLSPVVLQQNMARTMGAAMTDHTDIRHWWALLVASSQESARVWFALQSSVQTG